MYFREKSVNFISRLECQEQEREPCAPIFSRVMDFNFVLSSEIAVSKVVSVVQERIFGDQNTSVFFLKDLRRSYQDQLEYRGGDEDIIKNVKITRLTEQLLGKIPLLQEQKKNEKFVLLTVEEDVGRAIVECLQNTWPDEGILSKAARIVPRFLFTKEETFEGSAPFVKFGISYTLWRNNN